MTLMIFSFRSNKWLSSILGIMSLCGALSSAQAVTPEETLKSLFETRYQGVGIQSVKKTPFNNLYEVVLDDQIVYTDEKNTFVMMGELFDTATKRNLTAARVRELTSVPFSIFPLKNAIKTVQGTGQNKIVVFSDPDCPYCKELEKELTKVNNITVYTFLLPLASHPDAARKAQIIWCSADSSRAWHDHMLRHKLDSKSKKECDTPIDANLKQARELRINGTPTLFFENGLRVPGAISANQIEEILKQK